MKRNWLGVVVVLSIALSGCADKAAKVSAGPSQAYSTEQRGFLDSIYAAKLVESDLIDASTYLQLGDYTCSAFKQGAEVPRVLAALGKTAESTGLKTANPTHFAAVVGSSAIAYLCPNEQFTKLPGPSAS